MDEHVYEVNGTSSFDEPPKKSNIGLIIAIVVVVLLLCCCCIALLAFGWLYGDQIIEALSRVAPSLLIA